MGEPKGLGASNWRYGDFRGTGGQLYFSGFPNFANLFDLWLALHHAVALVWCQLKKYFAEAGICENIQSIYGNTINAVIDASYFGTNGSIY